MATAPAATAASTAVEFTPECLKQIEGAPVFTLKEITSRERRFRRRILLTEGATLHDDQAIRSEILHALESKLWGAEKFEKHSAPLLAYWDALDTFAAEKAKKPDLEWAYDEAAQQSVLSLLRDVEQSWQPLGRMKADNADFSELFLAATVAVTLDDWTGLEAPKDRHQGHFTLECVDRLASALGKFAEAHGTLPTLAWLELANACSDRFMQEA